MIFFYLAEVSKLTQLLADSVGPEHILGEKKKPTIWIVKCWLGSIEVGIDEPCTSKGKTMPFTVGLLNDIQGSGLAEIWLPGKNTSIITIYFFFFAF